jgi:hypothetical protein
MFGVGPRLGLFGVGSLFDAVIDCVRASMFDFVIGVAFNCVVDVVFGAGFKSMPEAKVKIALGFVFDVATALKNDIVFEFGCVLDVVMDVICIIVFCVGLDPRLSFPWQARCRVRYSG